MITPRARLAFAVMAKAPRAGRIKTRLTPPLTPEQAVALGGSFIADVAATIRRTTQTLHAAGEIHPYIAYMPEGAEAQIAALVDFEIGLVLADGAAVTDAGVTGIGRGLLQATRNLLADGYTGVCLISADSPSLPGAMLVAAADALAQPGERMVLGPADDGGYYLIGLKTAHPALFRDIAWSTATVAATTCTRARAIGIDCVTLPPWYDVDDGANLARLMAALEAGTEVAPRTAAALQRFGLHTA